MRMWDVWCTIEKPCNSFIGAHILTLNFNSKHPNLAFWAICQLNAFITEKQKHNDSTTFEGQAQNFAHVAKWRWEHDIFSSPFHECCPLAAFHTHWKYYPKKLSHKMRGKHHIGQIVIRSWTLKWSLLTVVINSWCQTSNFDSIDQMCHRHK